MSTGQLDFASDDSLTGFRLQSLEVLNWGTFNKQVWNIAPHGRNSLLTGDIGSGKSTLVDAITTLLVPHQRIVYNKAAGAENKERSLYSYVRGEYKSEQDDMTQGARAVALRDEHQYSVLLATFHNSGFDQTATLAQVFWLKPGQRNPERFFVFAEKAMNISDHFSNFGERILDLKKQLRKLAATQVFDTFSDYEGRFRRYFGIKQKNALELFYQTVSMKSVGRLTDFVRKHMLDDDNNQGRINELKTAFDNLNRAHESVLKARDQITLLEPLVSDGEQFNKLLDEIQELTDCRDSLVYWFAEHEVTLTGQEMTRLRDRRQRVDAKTLRLKHDISDLRLQSDKLKQDIDNNGGMLLRSIDEQIGRLEQESERRRHKWRNYAELCEKLELVTGKTIEQYQANHTLVGERLHQQEEKLLVTDEQKLELSMQFEADKKTASQLEEEINSLRQRTTNIPLSNLKIRHEMSQALQLDETELTFAGELMQVVEDQSRWRGAIERVMHNIALSLLVPERHYKRVNQYVDATHLRGRVVYFRTGKVKKAAQSTNPQALFQKIHVKADSEHYDWLDHRLRTQFDHICCEDLEDFRHNTKALSIHGQVKTTGFRHEKDDRHNLQDPSRYVLGWDNKEKIKALQASLDSMTKQIVAAGNEITRINSDITALQRLRDSCRDLINIQPFDEIDWFSRATEIEQQKQQKREIEDSSDQLKSLRTQLRIIDGAMTRKEEKYATALQEAGTIENRLEQTSIQLTNAQSLVEQWPQEWQPLGQLIDTLFSEVSGGQALSLSSLDRQQRDTREHIQNRLDSFSKRRNRLAENITGAMSRYKNAYKVESQEVDASLNAIEEYSAMLTELKGEDLPRHEQRFREMLKEQTTNGLAMFHAQLQRDRQEIEDRINTINQSLRQIDYNPGTYIALLSDFSRDSEISEFQQQLRGVTEGALNEDELYTEKRFLLVKAIIDRFNGRDGRTELDRRWTLKVTDVRNWFNFSASERWSEDDSEKEFYSDSAGKSGGQKEKLAYTILASALAYQFGLEWGNVQSRSFRFVVIDEAFGRGSDESTRYGLELFDRLNLQLLIVTPLQKIHIIENHIDAVHFVHNEDGRNSLISNLTLAQYKAGKRDKAKPTPAVA